MSHWRLEIHTRGQGKKRRGGSGSKKKKQSPKAKWEGEKIPPPKVLRWEKQLKSGEELQMLTTETKMLTEPHLFSKQVVGTMEH